MKSKRKLLEELCSKFTISHHASFACVCRFPSGRTMVVRTDMSFVAALEYARWFVNNNFCDCLVVRPYDVSIKGIDATYTLYDNVVEEVKDLPF